MGNSFISAGLWKGTAMTEISGSRLTSIWNVGRFLLGTKNLRRMVTKSVFCALCYISRTLPILQSLCVCCCSTGGFRGDGPHFMSYDVLDDEHKELFNLAFKVLYYVYHAFPPLCNVTICTTLQLSKAI